jgi:hypothetical protein
MPVMDDELNYKAGMRKRLSCLLRFDLAFPKTRNISSGSPGENQSPG